MIFLDVLMGVPGVTAFPAVIHLHESDATLDETAGSQAFLSERPRDLVVKTVEPPDRFLFLLKAEDLWHGGLHPEGELVRFDARASSGVIGVFDLDEAIEVPQKFELALLLLAVNLRSRRSEGQRILGVNPQPDTRVLGPEVVRAVRGFQVVSEGVAEDDELGQVFVERAQPVVNPGAGGVP